MSEQHSTKEGPAVYVECGLMYPCRRLPDGEITRMSDVPNCRCGSNSFVEMTISD